MGVVVVVVGWLVGCVCTCVCVCVCVCLFVCLFSCLCLCVCGGVGRAHMGKKKEKAVNVVLCYNNTDTTKFYTILKSLKTRNKKTLIYYLIHKTK